MQYSTYLINVFCLNFFNCKLLVCCVRSDIAPRLSIVDYDSSQAEDKNRETVRSRYEQIQPIAPDYGSLTANQCCGSGSVLHPDSGAL